MSDLSREELRDVQMAAADAQRLQNDPTLWSVLRVIKAQATRATTYGPDAKDRQEARFLSVAIDLLASELQNRIDTAISLADVQRRARTFE